MSSKTSFEDDCIMSESLDPLSLFSVDRSASPGQETQGPQRLDPRAPVLAATDEAFAKPLALASNHRTRQYPPAPLASATAHACFQSSSSSPSAWGAPLPYPPRSSTFPLTFRPNLGSIFNPPPAPAFTQPLASRHNGDRYVMIDGTFAMWLTIKELEFLPFTRPMPDGYYSAMDIYPQVVYQLSQNPLSQGARVLRHLQDLGRAGIEQLVSWLRNGSIWCSRFVEKKHELEYFQTLLLNGEPCIVHYRGRSYGPGTLFFHDRRYALLWDATVHDGIRTPRMEEDALVTSDAVIQRIGQ